MTQTGNNVKVNKNLHYAFVGAEGEDIDEVTFTQTKSY
jgi:hypothetical protein